MVDYVSEYYSEDDRYYVGSDDNHYLSVTSILGRYEDKTALDKWIARVGEAEANRIRDEAAAKGTKAHGILEDYLNNTISLDDISDDWAKVSIEDFYSSVVTDSVEQALFYPLEEATPKQFVGIAGRYDQLVSIPKKSFIYTDTLDYVEPGLVLVDLKTKTKSPRLDKLDYILRYILQLSTYAQMLRKTKNREVKGACIVFAIQLKTKSKCIILHIDKESLEYYWLYMRGFILHYYKIRDDYTEWRDIIIESGKVYDFLLDDYLNYLPRQIVKAV